MRRLGDILDLENANVALGSREIAGLATDSRKARPGDVFFALAGAKDDGLKHVGEALAKGAAVVVAEREAQLAGVAFVRVLDARAALAKAAARFFPRQPETIVGVTGTSGKTSVAAFVREIWQALGRDSASLGTIGVVSRPVTVYGPLTTPDPIVLHQTLDRLAGAGVTHLALEASSHGLDQKRLDGVRLAAGAFTNLTRDHMDYHPTSEDYLAAKLRLFRELLPSGAPAVVDADADIAPRVIEAARSRSLDVVTVGAKGETIRLVSAATAFPRRSNWSSAGGAAAQGCACRATSRSPMRWSPPGCASRQAATPTPRSRRCNRFKARRAGSSASAGRVAQRSLLITPTSLTRSKRRSRPCGPTCEGV